MTISTEPMSSVDTAWLHMDQPDNHMIITGVLILDQPLDRDRFNTVLENRLLHFDRFRQKVVERNGNAYWENDPHFHLDNHVHRIGLPEPAGQAELQELVADIASEPLDFSHPLWKFYLVDHYESGAALITRIHHCIADGLALVRVMMSLADDTWHPEALETPAGENSLLDRLTRPFMQVATAGAYLGHDLINEGLAVARHPGRVNQWAEKAEHIASELVHIGLSPRDPDTRLHKTMTGRKRVAWAQPLDLAAVKETAHQLEGTVNDVLMTCAAGALRRYLAETDNDHYSDIHVAVPFSLRPRDKPISHLGNQFGLVIVALPIGEPNVRQRYERVKKAMVDLKHSVQPQVTFGLLDLLGKGPAAIEKFALDTLSDKASLVMTNVPGPTTPLIIAGARVLQPLVWVPQSGHLGVGFSILSYAGTVQFGVIADSQMIQDPAHVTRYFEESFEELQRHAHGGN
ncbi:wax ester/triacylglycerol synthase family O-acyltransferase [Marinobacter sp. CHS3-4]|uniref:WS/DGAT/MGAT family O-acyltransferase n=1 Tax=Marinobacter sp. CHS3-4 TaxID=3045174 RepID=UPI0024B4EF2D|nr:wax ester/triacylglycerol synthase family O-acyltransferase [Marinobacter sp. CHS3-4]MDI9246723.1 wax ester/triacylglycerol synthase family O-acyltransferase [Marinobacter sp. CHS3-4]